jgi:hypothetical protein
MARIPIPLYTERQTAASGPDLSANAQGGRLGDYAAQADQGLGDAFAHVGSIAERLDENQALAWSTNAASKFKVDQDQKLMDAKDNAPVGGSGLTKKYLGGYDTDAQALMAQAPTARAKKYLDVHLNSYRTVMGNQAVHEEYNLGKQYLVSSTQDAVNSSAQLIGAPGGDRSRLGPELATQLASIKALSLPPDVKDKLFDHAKKTLTDAYWNAYIRDDPQGAASLLRGRQPLSVPGTVSPQDAIRSEAKAQGVDPRIALAVASMENDTFDPSRGNESGNKDAKGLFQVIGSTWNALGGTDENRLDMPSQAKFGVKNVAQNTRALQDTLHRQPTPGEIYSTQWGLGFAGALANAPDSQPVRDIFAKVKIPPDAGMSQNKLPDSMTAGQLRAAFNQQMAKAMNRTAAYANAPEAGQEPAAPLDDNARKAIDNTPIPQQMAYLTHAESMARRDDSQQKAAMEGRIQDTAAAYTNLQDAPNPPSLPELVDTYGAVRGAQQYARLQDLQGYAHTGAAFATMPTAQIASTLLNQRPSPGEGYADKAVAFNKLVETAQKIDTQRRDDPLMADQTIGAHLTDKVDWQNDSTLFSQLRKRYAQSQQVASDYGTAYTPTTKQDAAELTATLEQLPPKAVLDKLSIMRAAAGGDTTKYATLLQKIAPSHPSVAIAGMLADSNPQAAQFILAGDRALNPSKDEKGAEGKTPNLLLPDTKQFAVSWDQNRGAAFTGIDDDARAHLNAAIAYYVGALPPGKRDAKNVDDTTWQAAMKAVAPVAQDLTGRDVLIPSGFPASLFQNAVTEHWPQALQAFGLDAKDYPAEAYSLLSAGQDGVYVPYDGSGVPLMAGGQRVVLNLTDQPLQSYTGITLPPPLSKRGKINPMRMMP